MIEPIMYLAIGFLVSMLFGLMIVPLVHNRAVRLTTRRLEAARSLGVTIALDDFGTGYSSLSYLRTLPVDTLKIDRSFIDDIDRAASAGAMVKAIIALGEATGRTMVAEGVERQAQAELLSEWGCHYIQGFLLHSPMPPAELTQLLRGLVEPVTLPT